MKKGLKRVLIIIAIIAVILLIIYLYAMSLQEKEIKNGKKENEIKFDVSDVPNNLTVTFIGDSLTQGCMTLDEKSTCDYFPQNFGYRDNVELNLDLENSYNFAVGGYTTDDVEKQMKDDVTLGEVNQIIVEESPHLEQSISPLNTDLTISEAIKNSDLVISTIGGNDVLDAIEQNDDGSIAINYGMLRKSLGKANDNKTQIYEDMKKLNPDVKIIDVGMYMSYPHIGDGLVDKLYPVLVFAEGSLFIDDPKNEIYYVQIRDNMQVNIKEYVPNPVDVHPTSEGYDVIANEILKAINNAYK